MMTINGLGNYIAQNVLTTDIVLKYRYPIMSLTFVSMSRKVPRINQQRGQSNESSFRIISNSSPGSSLFSNHINGESDRGIKYSA